MSEAQTKELDALIEELEMTRYAAAQMSDQLHLLEQRTITIEIKIVDVSERLKKMRDDL